MPLRRCFATPTESQAADITQLLFGADTYESLEDFFAKDFEPTLRANKEFTLKSEGHGETKILKYKASYNMEFDKRISTLALLVVEDVEARRDLVLHIPSIIDDIISQTVGSVDIHGCSTFDIGEMVKLKDLKFSGMVYLYHKQEMGLRLKADIEEAFKERGLILRLRGPQYASMRNIAKSNVDRVGPDDA